MAITFPRPLSAIADQLKVDNVAWSILRQDEMSAVGNGDFLSHDMAPQLWEGEGSTITLSHNDARKLRAQFNALDGSNQAFYLYDPASMYPAADPTGSKLGSATPTLSSINANRKTIQITGLPSGYVLKEGDMFHVDYGSGRRALLEVVEAATASGGGLTPAFEIRPHLRPGITTGLAVALIKPAAKVKLMPGTFRVEPVSTIMSRIRFRARQTLQAG